MIARHATCLCALRHCDHARAAHITTPAGVTAAATPSSFSAQYSKHMDATEHAPLALFTLTGRVCLNDSSVEPQRAQHAPQPPPAYTLPTSLTLDTPYFTSVPNAFTMMPAFEQQQQLPFRSIPAYATPAMLPHMHHHSPAYFASPMWSSHPHINHMHASGSGEHDHASRL